MITHGRPAATRFETPCSNDGIRCGTETVAPISRVAVLRCAKSALLAESASFVLWELKAGDRLLRPGGGETQRQALARLSNHLYLRQFRGRPFFR
jgi:hypothetical protein